MLESSNEHVPLHHNNGTYSYSFPFLFESVWCVLVSLSLYPALLILEITTSGGDTVAGEQYTLTCTVTVPESSGLTGTPTVEWTGDEGKTGVTEGTAMPSGRVTTLTLTFNPLQDSQDVDYTCSATLPVSGMDPATGMNVFTLDVVGMSQYMCILVFFICQCTLCLISLWQLCIQVHYYQPLRCVYLFPPPAPEVTVTVSATGGAPIVGGSSYSLTCDHHAPQSLMVTVQSALRTPDGTTITSLPHTFNPLRVTDGGQYRCTATVSSPYLNDDFTATQGAPLDVVVESK